MDEITLAMVHRGTRIHATVEYDTDKNFDGGEDIMIASVMYEERDILPEMDQREIEQLEAHVSTVSVSTTPTRTSTVAKI